MVRPRDERTEPTDERAVAADAALLSEAEATGLTSNDDTRPLAELAAEL